MRNNATRKDEITKPATRKVEIQTRKEENTPREKTPFKTVNLSSFSAFRLFAWRYFVFRLFAWRSFVFSRGVISSFRVASFRVSLFRLFAWRLFDFSRGVFSCGVISSFRVALFRLFAWRYFVFSRGAFSFFRVALFRGEKTKWHRPATIFTCAEVVVVKELHVTIQRTVLQETCTVHNAVFRGI